MVGMRAEILQVETAASPQLSLQAGAPLVHARRGLVPGVRVDGSCGGARWTDSRRERIGQSGYRESSSPGTGKLIGIRRVHVQQRVAIGLVGVVIDAAAGPEHGFFAEAVGDS